MPVNDQGQFIPDQAELTEIYSAAIDSVAYIEGGKPQGMSEDEWTLGVKRNTAHLSFVTGAYDLSGFDVSRIEAALGA
jgi:hypothetical protein